MSEAALPVIVAPRLDPALERRVMLAPAGATLAEIVAAALPSLPDVRRPYVRVMIGVDLVPVEMWASVRPKRGAPVMVRVVPAGGGGALKQILMIAVSVAAMAIGQFWLGPALASSVGVFSSSTWGAIGTAATMMAGALLVNALIPQKSSKSDRDATRYAISGQQNQIAPDAPVPMVLGEIRFAPPFAALPYTDEVGDTEQYFYGLYVIGVGAHAISDLRIGDTPIDRYKGVTVEVRSGWTTDDPVSLTPQQIYEDATQAQISMEDGPIRRISGGDASSIAVAIRFPAGLIEIDSKKGKRKSKTVQIAIRARLAGTENWQETGLLTITRQTSKDFRVSHRWDCPERGRYEIEISRLTADYDDSDNIQASCHLATVRTFRPEYPINMPSDAPLALIAIRIRASRQLQGMVDNLTAIVSPVIADWDAATGVWVTRSTRNPASLARHLLQGPGVAYPLPDDQIDFTALQEWHEFCAAKGLHYDGVITDETKLRETLADVCTAGRARPLPIGEKWSVVIDRPKDAVTAVITPRNAREIGWSPAYTRFPDAVRVPFLDRSNDNKKAERVVNWIGFTGTPHVVEQWEFPGLTDAGEIWRAARRRMRELIYRPIPYTARQDVEHLVLTPGDRVRLSHPDLVEDAIAARVVSASTTRITLDAPVTMSSGLDYMLRIRDADGGLRVASVVTTPGETTTLALPGALDPPPRPGDLAIFGRYEATDVDCIVTRIEPGDDWTATIHMAASAPQIDAETDADTPPVWDGRAGGVVTHLVAPAAPRIMSIASGYELSDPASGVLVVLAPAAGETIVISRYDVRFHSVGMEDWGYVNDALGQASLIAPAGAEIAISARAVSIGGVRGPWSAEHLYTVLPATAAGPVIATLVVDKLLSGLRRYAWTFAAPPSDVMLVELRYRAGTWTNWDDLTPLHSGVLTASPYEASTPADDGLYTVAARAQTIGGDIGPVKIVTVSTQPTPPQSISAAKVGSDIRVTVSMGVAQDSGSIRIYRSLASAAATTETEVSGLITAPPASTAVWTDAGAAAVGQPSYRYRARAENSGGVQSLSTSEALP